MSLVGKATELSHSGAKEINQIKGVRRIYGFQADVTAKNNGMDSKNMCRKLHRVWNFWGIRYQSGYSER